MVTDAFVHRLAQCIGSFLGMEGMSLARCIVGAVGGIHYQGDPGPPAPWTCCWWQVRCKEEVLPRRFRCEVGGQSATRGIEHNGAT